MHKRQKVKASIEVTKHSRACGRLNALLQQSRRARNMGRLRQVTRTSR